VRLGPSRGQHKIYQIREVIKLEKVRLERFYCTKFRVYPTSYSKFVHENFTINVE
jgi:hypothetical protein